MGTAGAEAGDALGVNRVGAAAVGLGKGADVAVGVSVARVDTG